MIEHDLLKGERLLLIKPDGPLAKEDFEQLAQTIDPMLEDMDRLNGLMIDAPEFPGWKDFAGLISHIKFVKNHHQQIKRVAVVSDNTFVKRLPTVARHFVNAELRRFSPNQRDDALAWLSRELNPEKRAPASLRFVQNEEPPAIWIEVNGRVTRDDYLKLLEPMKEQFEASEPVSILVELKEYDGMECGAVWEDIKFGCGHLKNLRRMAIVTDKKWLTMLTKLMDPLFAAEMKPFSTEQEMEAWGWAISKE